MSDIEIFRESIRRIRSGDNRAALELVQRYEPLIRREVRLHLEDHRLRRVFDSLDVTQSVLASFFVRTAAGEFDLENPHNLVALLVKMTRNKLVSMTRKLYQSCRDVRKIELNDVQIHQAITRERLPSDQLELQELLQSVRQQLTAQELQLAELRAEGCSWDDVANRLGGTAQARRMQLSRGIQRARENLGVASLID